MRHPVRLRAVAALTALQTALLATGFDAQNTAVTTGGDVRQIVTFLWQPGASETAASIFERALKPIYISIPSLKKFRAYREVESPEPLDLVVVSTYDSMAGMDAANAALRTPNAAGE
jgi:hypothetical protein